jgi:diguanylate cyclase (GGDEF)-like protein
MALTVSIGVCSLPAYSTCSLEALYTQADQALYTAKAAGRNRVVQLQAPAQA